MGGMWLFFAAIRSGWRANACRPSLTIGAQMSFALLVGALPTRWWACRGAVFPIMMVVLMFGLYSLTPRQVRLMSAGAGAVRCAAMA